MKKNRPECRMCYLGNNGGQVLPSCSKKQQQMCMHPRTFAKDDYFTEWTVAPDAVDIFDGFEN